MEELNYELFRASILKIKESRKHKVTKSLGVYDAYKYIRKRKWLNIGRPLTEHEFYSIIRLVNIYLAELLSLGHDILLPYRMGTLEIRKTPVSVSIKDGKVKVNLCIDWDATLKLWYEDKESFINKTLVRIPELEVFKIYYNKINANYNNKSFYEYIPNRELKKALKRNIKLGIIEAFALKR